MMESTNLASLNLGKAEGKTLHKTDDRLRLGYNMFMRNESS